MTTFYTYSQPTPTTPRIVDSITVDRLTAERLREMLAEPLAKPPANGARFIQRPAEEGRRPSRADLLRALRRAEWLILEAASAWDCLPAPRRATLLRHAHFMADLLAVRESSLSSAASPGASRHDCGGGPRNKNPGPGPGQGSRDNVASAWPTLQHHARATGQAQTKAPAGAGASNLKALERYRKRGVRTAVAAQAHSSSRVHSAGPLGFGRARWPASSRRWRGGLAYRRRKPRGSAATAPALERHRT